MREQNSLFVYGVSWNGWQSRLAAIFPGIGGGSRVPVFVKTAVCAPGLHSWRLSDAETKAKLLAVRW